MFDGGNVMRKTFKLEDLDCANCAAKIEKAIQNIEGVKYANVSFMMQKLTIEIDDADFTNVMQKVKATIKKIEPDCSLLA